MRQLAAALIAGVMVVSARGTQPDDQRGRQQFFVQFLDLRTIKGEEGAVAKGLVWRAMSPKLPNGEFPMLIKEMSQGAFGEARGVGTMSVRLVTDRPITNIAACPIFVIAHDEGTSESSGNTPPGLDPLPYLKFKSAVASNENGAGVVTAYFENQNTQKARRLLLVMHCAADAVGPVKK